MGLSVQTSLHGPVIGCVVPSGNQEGKQDDLVWIPAQHLPRLVHRRHTRGTGAEKAHQAIRVL